MRRQQVGSEQAIRAIRYRRPRIGNENADATLLIEPIDRRRPLEKPGGRTVAKLDIGFVGLGIHTQNRRSPSGYHQITIEARINDQQEIIAI